MNIKIIICLIVIVLSSLMPAFQTMACISVGNDLMVVIFKPGSGIDMRQLQTYCQPGSCVIPQSQVIYYQAHSDPRGVILVMPFHKDNSLTFFSILLSDTSLPEFDWPMALLPETSSQEFDWQATLLFELRLLLKNNLLYGMTEDEIATIASLAVPGNFIYFKPESCGNSYRDGTINDSKQMGWIRAAGNCAIETYEGNCPKIGCYRCGGGGKIPRELIPTEPLHFPIPEVE